MSNLEKQYYILIGVHTPKFLGDVYGPGMKIRLTA